MPNNLLVSIVTPVRNDRKYIARCIQSVLLQEYPHIEHVIVDGASTDGTLDIISNYSKKFPQRIRFISEPDNGGADAWNKGLKMAKGDIFG
ncbi:MAG: glycosyltransferase, partial [Candidatus Omnitrophica bacterium CG11_big_fil_rev_8_21_14_0_20_43_6]